MLLEFRLRNFRAFRDEALLSLVASNDETHAERNTLPTGLGGIPRALRAAVIYGPNAGGKTTALRGLQLMRGVVLESANLRPDQRYLVQPFRLDATAAQQPTLFEATVLLDGVRYQYGFEFTAERIIAEWLVVYETRRPQQWIDRRFDPGTGEETVTFGPRLSGPKRVWQEATRPNALILSTAIQLNSERLRPLFDWFATRLFVVLGHEDVLVDPGSGRLEDPRHRGEVARLLGGADTGIRDIHVVRRKTRLHALRIEMASGAMDPQPVVEREVLTPMFRHEANGVGADFDLGDESTGTQRLFNLADPLLDFAANGGLLAIDEIDRSLHPLLVRAIIERFQDTAGPAGQLLCTTHDTSLLDPALLRRDQIWFAEKNASQAASLSSLADLAVRKDSAFERAYLTGRYGGLPILGPAFLKPERHGQE